MLEKLKKEYENALNLQSYEGMKTVAQKLFDIAEISEIEESGTFITYTKYLTFRGTEYQVDVESIGEGTWYFRITNTDNVVIDFGEIEGSDEDQVGQVEKVFEKIKSNFVFHLKESY